MFSVFETIFLEQFIILYLHFEDEHDLHNMNMNPEPMYSKEPFIYAFDLTPTQEAIVTAWMT